MDKLKYIKIKQEDGTYSEEVPVGVDASNVDMSDGRTLPETLGLIDVDANGTVKQQLDELNKNKVDKNSYNSKVSELETVNKRQDTQINQMIANPGTATEGNSELLDIRVGVDGESYSTAGEAIRSQFKKRPKIKDTKVSQVDTWSSEKIDGEIGSLSEKIVNNNEMLAYGETMLDMKWQQGYWYSIKNGEYNIATPQENYVACKYKIDGDCSTLIATKQNGLGFTMFICEYDLNDAFLRGYQYGNTILNLTLEKGKKYAFSISSTAGVTVESATVNYIFLKSVNIVETNKKLKNYIDFGNIYYIGATREITTLKEGLKKACEKKNSVVYVDAGEYDIIQEYGNDYFENYSYSSSDCGIVLKNNVNVIFSPKSKVICNYTGNNHDIMFYFSPFNVGAGGFRVENLNIECSRVRYCVHDDLGMFGNSHDFTKTEYQNCNMYLDNSQNTARESYNCIGGGLPYNGEVVINGCIFESTAVSPKYGGVDYHQNGANGAKSKSLITNCYFKGRMDRYSCSNLGQTEEISTVIVTNCSSGRTEGYAKKEQYSDSIYFLAWNNIRRPD